MFSRTETVRPGGRCLLWLSVAALLAFGQVARAQDAPKPTPEEEELKKAAEAEAEKEREKPKAATPAGAPATPLEEEARLRQDAVRVANDEDRGQAGSLIERALSSMGSSLNMFNPRMTVIGDVTGRLATNRQKTVEGGASPDDRVALREVELDLRADVDPFAKAVAIVAVAEDGPGSFEIDVEEAYVTLETLPWSFRAKLGRFLVPFGRMNALHTHDLPHTTSPLFLRDLFGEESYKDNGALFSWLAPVPIELTAAVLNGENERALYSSSSVRPAFFGRAEGFAQLTDTAFLSLGTSYLFGWTDARGPVGRPSHPRLESSLGAVDLLFKWQPSTSRSVVIQAEYYRVFRREHLRDFDGVDPNTGAPITVTRRITDEADGVFAFIQVQPMLRWYVGARYDWSNYDEGIENSRQWAASGWIAFYTTEFLRFRLGYEHRERSGTGNAPRSTPNDTLFFQITFVFGSHPAEPFWVNR